MRYWVERFGDLDPVRLFAIDEIRRCFGNLLSWLAMHSGALDCFGTIEVWQIGYFCLLGHDHPLEWLGVGLSMDNDVQCSIDEFGFDRYFYSA